MATEIDENIKDAVSDDKIIRLIKEKLEHLCKRKLSGIMNENVV